MGMPLVVCYVSRGGQSASNDCKCCAERNLLVRLRRESIRKGVRPHGFSSWLHRVYGDFIVWRHRKDDPCPGVSVPCVVCRKTIERHRIQWVAYTAAEWIHSNRAVRVPVSKPTNRQARELHFSRPCNTESFF